MNPVICRMPHVDATERTIRTAVILATGSEILHGLYPDTNSCHLAGQLSAKGIEVLHTLATGDEPGALESAVRFAASRAELVVCSGGLGPTEDDINRHVFARVWGVG